MRFPRVKAEGQGFYHCVSRVVDRQFIFQTAGRGSPEGIRIVLDHSDAICWKEVSQQYRKYPFVDGSLHTKTGQPAFDLATAQAVVDQQNGELSLTERLRCRIRYFTDGLILGSQSFVESHFYNLKRKLGYQRRCLPRA